MMMVGTYDYGLVALSIFIAMLAAYSSLRLLTRGRAAKGWVHRIWIAAAAGALGGGIWSMHFVGMLAFRIPGMITGYDPVVTLLSLAIAITLTGIGFAIAGRQVGSLARTIGAGLMMASGIVVMHYMGMAAMSMAGTIVYSMAWVTLSVVIAAGAATAAIWLGSRDRSPMHQAGAAIVMGMAIAGMHYTGMQAATFIMQSDQINSTAASVSSVFLALLVSAITMLILLIALVAERVERLFQQMARREARAALRLEVADLLRAHGPEALADVAALMGSHFDVNRAGYGQLDLDEDIFDYDICWTDGTVPELLGRLPATAFGVKIVAALNRGETIVVDDLLRDTISDELLTQTTAREVDTRSILVVPFVRDGRVRTIVYLNAREPRQWMPDDIQFMEEIAERTRLVIERANAENQLRELNTTLEARIEARTSELRETQDALLQSQKMEAVGQLVSGLAHDFNNVLAAIVGAFELIQRRVSDVEKVQHYSNAGLQAADRGARLTAQLLTFSRSQRIQLRPLFICDVIDGMTDMLSRTLGPMIEIQYIKNPDPVPVLADPLQLEMMLLNLAINARDAMPEGGQLVVATKVRSVVGDLETLDGQYVELSVADTGIGMDETTLRRALEPFYTTKPAGKGTGLGLAQIYGSAKQAGGTVKLESAVGVGTTVRVLLPTTYLPVNNGEIGTEEAVRLCERTRILLVDDDETLRDLVATALRAHGHIVSEAPDGGTALEMLSADIPDVAIIDFAMPGMTGATLATHIAKRWPTLCVLFASGFSDTAAIERAVGKGAKIVQKPFRVDELLKAVGELLSSKERSVP
jgi:NO-binding membrane sensor protein with MHYT domain/nitrogen-specific signal transduction histidine kinase/ActR/RegA family two-component response regulator